MNNKPAGVASPSPLPTSQTMKRFVRLPEVLEAVGVSERTLYDMMRRGEFPRPAKIGKMSMWVDQEVAQWQLARLAERPATTAAA